jgi:DNA-3-methyladenine glycosylase
MNPRYLQEMILPALPPEYFARPTLTVAQDLLGCFLVVNNQPFRIVETEAYTQEDPACHAFGRTTGRSALLYGSPGLAYVYLIYGMHHCLNVVTEAEGRAGAVLFRAVEPPADYTGPGTHGPGRLCKALGITKENLNGQPLTQIGPVYLAPGTSVANPVCAPRVGIRQATDWLWRFYDPASRWVSVR